MALSLRSQTLPIASRRTPSLSLRSPVPTVALPATQLRRVVARAEAETSTSVDTEKVMKDLQEKWEKIDNKPQVALYAGGGVFALWLTATVIGAINHVPVLPKLLELIGLGYSAWFTYRYLLFKASREELIKDVEELKSKITGA